MNYDHVTGIYTPAYYVCTGNEHGEYDVLIDGFVNQIYVERATAGAIIKYIGGKFYCINGTVVFSQPEARNSETETDVEPGQQTEIVLPNEDEQEQIDPSKQKPGETSPYDDRNGAVFDAPITIPAGSDVEYYSEIKDGIVTAKYRIVGTDQWIEIPVLSRRAVARTEDGVYVKEASFGVSGNTLVIN